MQLSVRNIVISGILAAITIIMGYTGIGFIPVPTPAQNATIMHVPTILAGVLEGPTAGLITGAIFGVFSFLRPGAAMFTDPLVAVVPRIFIGLAAFLVFYGLKRFNLVVAAAAAGLAGSITNTVLVMTIAVYQGWLPAGGAVSVGLLHGPPEAILAAILTAVLVTGIRRVRSVE